MNIMPIIWKRLVTDGETCTRCGGTEQELVAAVAKLNESLLPLGIQPMLELRAIDLTEFNANPSESNRIWIAGKPLEEWIGADVGMSRCCSVCGDSDCRTLELAGRTYETIPEEVLIQAGLIAASQMLVSASPSQQGADKSCCPPASATTCSPSAAKQPKGGCCN